VRYIYDDGGRAAAGYKGNAGDCCARAFAIVSGRPYAEVYALITKLAGNERTGKRKRGVSSARTGVYKQTAHKVAAALGLVWTPTMRIGSGCTVHLRADELPQGRIVCCVSKHYCAVIDGVIHDTHDPSDRGTTIYPHGSGSQPPGTPEPSRPAHIPKGARWLANGNGWAYAPDRCVYGYWAKPGGAK
jgi:hypothetical protein